MSVAVWSATAYVPVVDETRCESIGALPACPNILICNDSDWIDATHARQALRQQDWVEGVRRPVASEVGAGVNLPTVRHFAYRLARRDGAALVRINPREPHVGTLRGVRIAGGALAALQAIDALLTQAG